MELETLENNFSTNLERVLEKIVMKSLAKSLEKVLERIEPTVEEKVIEKVVNNVEEKVVHNVPNKNASYINDVDLNEENPFISFPENEASSTKFIKENWDISWNYDIYNNSPPVVINSDYVIKGRKCYFLVNNKNKPTYINLINPSFYPEEWNKKQIIIKNLHDQPIFSVHDYIQQLDSNEISSVILPSNSKGKYVSLMTNGKNWYIKSIF